jgi:two-component system, NtrC family, nitrogen regulation sensor histidine kinase GlnL
MAEALVAVDDSGHLPAPDGNILLNALTQALMVVDNNFNITYANSAAEQFFRTSIDILIGKKLSDFIPPDSPVFGVIQQVREARRPISEYDVTLETPKIGINFVNIQASPVAEIPEATVVSIQHRSIADKIDRQLTHRGAARSVTAMASMLAHEVKNPLSGIRGAAQLLEQNANADDKDLTRLIRDEADRICDLVDRMGVFSDTRPLEREAVNIHQVLDRVHRLAKNGFAKNVRFLTVFDPSLPPVFGNRDQLVQVFLNLVKNAAEEVPEQGGEIILETAYQQGVRFAVPGQGSRVHLPLRVSVIDNGPGIPDDIRSYLFDPFVTSKPQGSGLGLALVAKIIDDHGGVIECDGQAKRTAFKVMLPMFSGDQGKT